MLEKISSSSNGEVARKTEGGDRWRWCVIDAQKDFGSGVEESKARDYN